MMENVVGPSIALLVIHQRGVEAGDLKTTIATPIVEIFVDVSSGGFGRKVIGRRGGSAQILQRRLGRRWFEKVRLEPLNDHP
jgi:hypothetical protein